MALPEPPTAIYAASDEMAIGVLRALRDEGRRVPQDVSVVGIDDHEMARFFDLTTVRQDVAAQGRRTAELVLAALEGAGGVEHVLAPLTLVVRETTGPPPT